MGGQPLVNKNGLRRGRKVFFGFEHTPPPPLWGLGGGDNSADFFFLSTGEPGPGKKPKRRGDMAKEQDFGNENGPPRPSITKRKAHKQGEKK